MAPLAPVTTMARIVAGMSWMPMVWLKKYATSAP